MAVLIGSREAAETLAADIPGLSIAAYNSPRAYHVLGSGRGARPARRQRRAASRRAPRSSTSPIPFHSALIDPIEEPLLRRPRRTVDHAAGTATFVSTVTGSALAGDAARRRLLVAQRARAGAVRAGRRGSGPARLPASSSRSGRARSCCRTSTTRSARATCRSRPCRCSTASSRRPIRSAARSPPRLARGAHARRRTPCSGSDPGPVDGLPTYPWQRKTYRLGDTAEAIAFLTPRPWHPLIGARYRRSTSSSGIRRSTPRWCPTSPITWSTAMCCCPAPPLPKWRSRWPATGSAPTRAAIADFEIHQPMILASTALARRPLPRAAGHRHGRDHEPAAARPGGLAGACRRQDPAARPAVAEAPPAWPEPAEAGRR